MGKKWQRKIEARLALLEQAGTPAVELPPALDIELPAHQPVVNHEPPALLASWWEDDDASWWEDDDEDDTPQVHPGLRRLLREDDALHLDPIHPDPRWGFGSYL